MSVVPYKHILTGVKNLIGLPEKETIEQRSLIRDLVSQRLAFIWVQARWPVLTDWEERSVTDDATNGDYIPLTEAGKDDIGAVFGVRDGNPVTSNNTKILRWRLGKRGIQVEDGQTSAWVFYRREKPRLVGDAFDLDTTYSPGQQVYESEEGDFFDVVQASLANPVTNTGFFKRVQIPIQFEQYLINGAYADWLRNDRQEQTAISLAERPAVTALKRALFELKGDQGQQVRPGGRRYGGQ